MTILACGCDTEHKIPRGEVYQGCPEHASVRCDGCQECNYSCETHVFPPKGACPLCTGLETLIQEFHNA